MVPMLWGYFKIKSDRRASVTLALFVWIKWIMLVAWMRHVSWFAVFGVAGAFTTIEWFWFECLRRKVSKQSQSCLSIRLVDCFLFGTLWAALEWLRSQPFGLPGAHMSIALWQTPEMIQIASVVGGYGLSGIIVTVNLLLTKFILEFRRCGVGIGRKFSPMGGAGLIVATLWWSGSNRLEEHKKFMESASSTKQIDVGVVQPYQPAVLEWTYEIMTDVIRSTLQESFQLATNHNIDLIVWPEGSLPGAIYPNSPMAVEVETLVKRINTPLLFGNQVKLNEHYYNGVLYCGPNAGISKKFYGKRILVPFGEYIPGRRFLGDITTIVPIPEDFNPGNGAQIMSLVLKEEQVNISALVCYEDCFPDLLLNDDMTSVDLVYVATYNVWYGEEFGAYFHAAHSVMRAVENGRSILRCGSAGWSGLISPFGEIQDVITESDSGSIYFRGADVVTWKKIPRLPLTTYDLHHHLIHSFYGAFAIVALLVSLEHFQQR